MPDAIEHTSELIVEQLRQNDGLVKEKTHERDVGR
jgi:hypothetical protein